MTAHPSITDTGWICKTKFWWGGTLVTFYLGIAHDFDHEQLLFETVLLVNENNPQELLSLRYPTGKRAIEGHSGVVRQLRNPLNVGALLLKYRFRNWL